MNALKKNPSVGRNRSRDSQKERHKGEKKTEFMFDVFLEDLVE